MSSKLLNEIIADSNENIDVKLIKYLMSIREECNLMIIAVSVSEMDWKKSYEKLKEAFKEKIEGLSDSDKNELSNFTTMIRYRDGDNQCMRALSVTFGRTLGKKVYDSSFKMDVNTFLENIPKYNEGLNQYLTLPIIRMALMLHSMRSSLDGSEQLQPMVLDEFALLDFNENDWRYTVREKPEQYEVKVNSNDITRNSFYLRVSLPTKQVFKKRILPCWIFDNKATGFSFYNIASIGNITPTLKNKPVYINLQNTGARKPKANENGEEPKPKSAEELNESNIKKLSIAISNHEAYWNQIMMDLLDKADIKYRKRVFESTDYVSVQSDFNNRGSELTHDFLGIESNTFVDENKFLIKYFIQPEIYIDEINEDEDNIIENNKFYSLIDQLNASISEIKKTQGTLPNTLSVEFEQVNTIEQANLVFGKYDKDKSWLSHSDINQVDDYGRSKIYDLDNRNINVKQFVTLDNEFNINKLKRAITESFMKKWLSTNDPKKNINININLDIENNKNKYIVLSTKRVKQKDSKDKKYNVYYCCYQVELNNKQLIFSYPNVYYEKGVDKPKGDKSLYFDEYYNNFIDNKLPLLSDLIDILFDSEDNDLIKKSISKRYINNDVTLIFEHDGKSILSIWETQYEDLWIPPDLDSFFVNKPTFEDFIQNGINAKAFTKKNEFSRVTQDKRLSKDPHYEIMLDSNKLLIQRKRFNQNSSIDRQILKQFTRIYPSNDIQSIKDCEFILSGLLSSEAGAYKDSGVSQTIYDKIFNLIF